jgi:hypothetical protein
VGTGEREREEEEEEGAKEMDTKRQKERKEGMEKDRSCRSLYWKDPPLALGRRGRGVVNIWRGYNGPTI